MVRVNLSRELSIFVSSQKMEPPSFPPRTSRIDALLGGLAGGASATLEEMLDDSEFWGEGEEEEIKEEMKLLREGGAGAVREQKMQDSVQAWLLAKRSAQISCARLRRLADHSGCGAVCFAHLFVLFFLLPTPPLPWNAE